MKMLSKSVVDSIKTRYPVGCRVKLDHMDDPWSKIPDGCEGTVMVVDDMGTIHVSWDCGSSLGVVYGEDACHRI